jgi:hypothetical protein
MIDNPFAALLLPDKEIVWTAESTPARSWLNGLAMFGVGVGLLVLCGPRFWSLVLSCYEVGDLFPLKLMSAGSALRIFVPILLVPFVFWIAIGFLRQGKGFIYGLSERRVFIAAANPAKRWVSASVVQIGGTVEMVEVSEQFNLKVPIQHNGEDTPFVEFGQISKLQFETALALVNKIIRSHTQ